MSLNTTEAHGFNRRKLKRGRGACRRGATLVELAISLLVFLTLVLGAIDLGFAVLRHQQLTEAARFVARQAVVRGNLSTELTVWGPTAMSGDGSDVSEVGNLFSGRIQLANPEDLQYTLEWIDGGNDSLNDHRVRVTASLVHEPLFVGILSGTLTLQTATTHPIAH